MTRRGYVDTSRGQLHYREAGEGDPVVLLHMTASSSVMYERVLPILASNRHAIAVDTPGFGLSDPLPGIPDIPAYAEALGDFFDALLLEKADVVGFHTGASIALEFAVSQPNRVRKLVLAAILALQNQEEASEWSTRILDPWDPDGKGQFVSNICWWLSQYVPLDDGEAFLSEMIARMQAGPDYLLAPSAVIAYDALAAVVRLSRETLFLSPEKDNLSDLTSRAFSLSNGMKTSYREIPGDDGAIYEYPEEFSAAILDFLG